MEEVGEIQTHSFHRCSFLDAVKDHRFIALEEPLKGIIVWVLVGPEASDELEGLLEGL